MADSAAGKLVGLLGTLSPDDRQVVTTWLLEAMAGSRPPGVGPANWEIVAEPSSPRASMEWPREERIDFVRGAIGVGEDHQVVTLRLPQERHAELRQWCADHNFSMAAVIRGLVDQFLAAQRPSE